MATSPQQTVPPETGPHRRTFTSFPDPGSHDSARDLENAQNDVAAIANAIVQFEPVTMLCRSRNADAARKLISKDVALLEMPADELWVRDSGPVYARSTHDDAVVGLDLNFNYWGNKYTGTVDQTVAKTLLKAQNVTRVESPLVLEGGALEFDGDGTLMATESSVINDNRNPGKTKSQIEQELKDLFGISKVVWFRGVKGKETTDCHVDALARFIKPGEVLLSRPHPEGDKDFIEVYKEAKQVLQSATDAHGRAFAIHEVEEPNPTQFEGDDIIVSYVNFALVNGGVVIAAFGDEDADARAAQKIQELFPDRKVVQVRLRGLLRLGGGIHCATKHQPMD